MNLLIKKEIQRDFSCLLISHLKNKPSNTRMLEVINQAAKIEFKFLLNGLNIDLIGMTSDEILQIIDKNTKVLKTKVKKLIFLDIIKLNKFDYFYLFKAF